MSKAAIVLALLLSIGATAEAIANHKPGHHKPPGHAKKSQSVPTVVIQAPVVQQAPAVQSELRIETLRWERFSDPEYAFEIDLPLGRFDASENGMRGISLYEVGGQGLIDVYGAANAQLLSPRAFAEELEQADRIEEVTYRAGGRNWFVLSGHYARDDAEAEDLIFYAKFMFSADRSRISAFEISYPLSEKRHYDSIVTRLEKSLSAPD